MELGGGGTEGEKELMDLGVELERCGPCVEPMC